MAFSSARQKHHPLFPTRACLQRHVKPFYIQPYSIYYALLGSQSNTITHTVQILFSPKSVFLGWEAKKFPQVRSGIKQNNWCTLYRGICRTIPYLDTTVSMLTFFARTNYFYCCTMLQSTRYSPRLLTNLNAVIQRRQCRSTKRRPRPVPWRCTSRSGRTCPRARRGGGSLGCSGSQG